MSRILEIECDNNADTLKESELFNECVDFLREIETSYPLAWDKINNKEMLESIFCIQIDTESFSFLDIIVACFQSIFSKKHGINFYLGRNIQLNNILYKPTIIDKNLETMNIIYFIVVGENGENHWTKLSYEEMPEYQTLKHFEGFEDMEIANKSLLTKAFDILNKRLYKEIY